MAGMHRLLLHKAGGFALTSHVAICTPDACRCRAGFTLIEILMALAIGSMIVAAAYTVYIAQLRGQAVQAASLELQQGLRTAIQTMANEIRMAGVDPTGKAGAEILVAERSRLRFTMDIDDPYGTGRYDGEISGPNEDVLYAVSARTGSLGRQTFRPDDDGERTRTGGLQPVLNDVDVLDFVYLDALGNILSETDLKDASGRERIRQVQVTIIARYEQKRHLLPAGHGDGRIYRNLSGEALNGGKQFANSFRRQKMSAAVSLRNTR